jgi:hypothetical protein
MSKSQSSVGITLSFEGDLFTFWEILKEMKAEAEKNNVRFDCGQITTLTEESG